MRLTITICVLCAVMGLGYSAYAGPAMIGVSCNNDLVTRDIETGDWTQITGSCCVTSVAVRSDGSLVGVGDDNKLYTKHNIYSGNWHGPVEKSCCVRDVTVLSDDTIVGVTTKKKVRSWTDNSGWKTYRKAGGVVSIGVYPDPDGSLLGLTAKGKLRTRPGLQGIWTNLDSSGEIMKDVAIQPDGTIYGVGKTTKGLHFFNTTTNMWEEMLEDTDCVKSIVSPGVLEKGSSETTTPMTTVIPTITTVTTTIPTTEEQTTTAPKPKPGKRCRVCMSGCKRRHGHR
ncbi:uncharacterized protein LOC144433431 [Glandiceps talaboti]